MTIETTPERTATAPESTRVAAPDGTVGQQAAAGLGVPPRPGTAPATSAPNHDLPALEAYRGLASLMVVVTHVGFITGAGQIGPWAGWLSRLDFGVALFFLLSGFLLFRPYVQAAYGRRRPVRTGDYVRRRYVRLYPALIVALIANYVITTSARDVDWQLHAQTFFLVQNYFEHDWTSQVPGMVQLWSLVVEVSFYLTLPLLALLMLGRGSRMAEIHAAAAGTQAATPTVRGRRAARRTSSAQRLLTRVTPRPELLVHRPAVVLVALIVVALSWRFYYYDLSAASRQLLWLPGFLDWFAGGMALAWLRERPTPVPQVLRQLAGTPGVCWSLALAGYWLCTPRSLGGPFGLEGGNLSQAMFKHVMYLVIAFLLLVPVVFGPAGAPWRAVAAGPVMGWLGRISFGVFLWHPMLMEGAMRLTGIEALTGSFWLVLVLTLVPTLIMGTLSYHYIEAPAQRRFRNGFRRDVGGVRVRSVRRRTADGITPVREVAAEV